MGMPDAGYILDELIGDYRECYPNLKGLAWCDSDGASIASTVEIRFDKSFTELPYDYGKNSEHDKEGFDDWENIKATIRDLVSLRGYVPSGRWIITIGEDRYDFEFPDKRSEQPLSGKEGANQTTKDS